MEGEVGWVREKEILFNEQLVFRGAFRGKVKRSTSR